MTIRLQAKLSQKPNESNHEVNSKMKYRKESDIAYFLSCVNSLNKFFTLIRG